MPGTAATALRAAGAWNGTSPLELDNHDVWYRVRFTGGGAEVLRFEGLATIADVWLNDEHLLRSENMFLPCEVTVWTQRANNAVHLLSQPYRLAGADSRAARAGVHASQCRARYVLREPPYSAACRAGVQPCTPSGLGARCSAYAAPRPSPSGASMCVPRCMATKAGWCSVSNWTRRCRLDHQPASRSAAAMHHSPKLRTARSPAKSSSLT